ncbi:hypothetical protein AKJ16_DCAP14743 [Drosera capensis]
MWASLVQYPHAHCTAIIIRWPLSRSVIECTHSPQLTLQFTCNVSKKVPVALAVSGTFTSVHFLRAVPGNCEAIETSDTVAYSYSLHTESGRDEQIETGEVLPGYQPIMVVEPPTELEKETMMSNKKVHWNKGRTPANKGKPHSVETRALISQRTREAMRDPKVKSCKTELNVIWYHFFPEIRKRMLERLPKKVHSHPISSYSDPAKAKISSSLRRFYEWKRLTNEVVFMWAESIAEAARNDGTSEEEPGTLVGKKEHEQAAKARKRLEWKRLTNKVFFSWAEGIADAARKGLTKEEELDWDSNNRIRREVCRERIKYYTVEGNRKNSKTARVGSAAKGTETLAEKEKHEQVTSEVNGEMIQSRQDGSFGARELSLRARLARLARLAQSSGKNCVDRKLDTREEVTVSSHPSLEKIDLQLIEKLKTRKKLSLADQILAAKSKRELTGIEGSVASSSGKD